MTALQEKLLDLGLEDLIALPEIAGVEEVRGVPGGDSVEGIGLALIQLLREGWIQVWAAHWSQEPRLLDTVTAVEFLLEPGYYEFNSPADRECRVYYVNVENLRVDIPSQ